MEPEKTPSDEETKQEIDIFLFSNGQEYSPPRKYHLKISELQFWKTTLSYLARAQYGSLHTTIDLYELDGRKVESPGDVRDCAVYVAVVPPDPFIYSGYDKYLVKASRSWERRFSKRLSGVETTNPDNSNKDSAPTTNQTPEENEIRLQITGYPRRSSDIPRSSLKTDKIKPVANQVSQRSNVSRKLNSATGEHKNMTKNKQDVPRKNIKNSKQLIAHKKSESSNATKSKSPAKSESLDQRSTSSARNTKTINLKIQDKINKTNTRASIEKKLKKDDTSNKSSVKQAVENSIPKISVKERISAFNESNKKTNVLTVNKIKVLPAEQIRPKVDAMTVNNNNTTSTVEEIPTSSILNETCTENETQGPSAEQLLISDKTLKVKSEARKTSNTTSAKGPKQIVQAGRDSVTNIGFKEESQMYVPTNDMDQITVNQRLILTTHPIQETDESKTDTLSVKQNDKPADTINPNSISIGSEMGGSIVDVAPKPEYKDTVILKKDIVNKEVKVIPLVEITNKQADDEKSLREPSEVVYDIKVPLLYFVPDKTINHMSNTNTSTRNDVAQTEDFTEAILILPPKLSNQSEYNGFDVKSFIPNTSSTPVKYVGHDGVKLRNEDSAQDTGSVSINKQKDKNSIPYNVFKNSTSDATSTFVDANDIRTSKQSKGQTENSMEVPNEDEISYFDSKCKSNTGTSRHNYLQISGVYSYKSEIITAFINPNHDKENNNVTPKVPANSPETEHLSETGHNLNTNKVIAFMQNGDIVDLKLSIQVKNTACILKTTEFTNMLKYNCVNDNNKTPNELTGGKSLQSLERVPPHLCCRKDNVVMYKCACCSPNNGETTRQADLPRYYILLPVMPLSEEESAKETNLNVPSDKEVQTSESLIAVNMLVSSVKETIVTLPCCDTSKVISSLVDIKRHQMMETIETSMVTETCQTCTRSETITSQDESSQTDWCDVLLEARPEPDGHYTFYLPPLHLLQEYRLRL